MSANRAAVFLDRDGVLVVPEFRDGRSYAPTTLDDFHIYPDAPPALARLKDQGYTLVEIAEVRKIFGIGMTMLGVFVGGIAVARYGLLRAMVIGAFAGPISNLLFIWLAFQEHNLWALFAAIGLDNVAGGIAGTCLIAYMSSLTSKGFTATQYALFSSLYAIPGRLIASQSGRIVEAAARHADAGGMLSGIKSLVASQAPENFAKAVERSGVTPSALGTGYITFFAYSALIGVFAIVLSLVVERRYSANQRQLLIDR